MPVPQPKKDCCAVILAGGLNSRMGGRNKTFLDIGGKTILSRLIETARPLFKEMVVVTRQPECYADYPLKVVQDIYRARSSLTGIHAGLKYATAPYALMLPCDAPFIQPALIQALLDKIEPEADVVVPVYNSLYQPLCAIYSKRCLPFIEDQLDRGDFKITVFFKYVRVKEVPQEIVLRADPQLRSFFNVNTPEALKEARKLISVSP